MTERGTTWSRSPSSVPYGWSKNPHTQFLPPRLTISVTQVCPSLNLTIPHPHKSISRTTQQTQNHRHHIPSRTTPPHPSMHPHLHPGTPLEYGRYNTRVFPEWRECHLSAYRSVYCCSMCLSVLTKCSPIQKTNSWRLGWLRTPLRSHPPSHDPQWQNLTNPSHPNIFHLYYHVLGRTRTCRRNL